MQKIDFVRFGSFLATLLLVTCATPATHAQQQFSLRWPVACDLGKTCFIQNYVDHDPSGQVLDFHCGHRTYDGHDGTDIRLPDLGTQKKGVEVLAVAPGEIMRMRDDMDDVSVKLIGRAAIAGRECGNGVIIDHKNGWSSQYCHMAKGSMRVKSGDSVVSGQAIGLVGLSGNTEFPHLHLTIRHDGLVVDPFADGAMDNGCNGGGGSLWSSEIRYESVEIINAGFADLAVTMDQIEAGELNRSQLNSRSAAIVAYVRTIGLQAGDEQEIELRSPNGAALAQYSAPKLPGDQAQYFMGPRGLYGNLCPS